MKYILILTIGYCIGQVHTYSILNTDNLLVESGRLAIWSYLLGCDEADDKIENCHTKSKDFGNKIYKILLSKGIYK